MIYTMVVILVLLVLWGIIEALVFPNIPFNPRLLMAIRLLAGLILLLIIVFRLVLPLLNGLPPDGFYGPLWR